MDYDKLYAELEVDEGRRQHLYKDTVGKYTIGVGHNIEDRGLPNAVIDLLLEIDVQDAVDELDRNIGWWRSLSDTRQRVLVNMCFNMGWPVLAGFKITLSLIRNGKYEQAAGAMLKSKWARQVGARAIRLAEMMKEG